MIGHRDKMTCAIGRDSADFTIEDGDVVAVTATAAFSGDSFACNRVIGDLLGDTDVGCFVAVDASGAACCGSDELASDEDNRGSCTEQDRAEEEHSATDHIEPLVNVTTGSDRVSDSDGDAECDVNFAEHAVIDAETKGSLITSAAVRMTSSFEEDGGVIGQLQVMVGAASTITVDVISDISDGHV